MTANAVLRVRGHRLYGLSCGVAYIHNCQELEAFGLRYMRFVGHLLTGGNLGGRVTTAPSSRWANAVPDFHIQLCQQKLVAG